MQQEEITAFYAKYAAVYDDTIFRDRDYTAFTKIPLWLTALYPDNTPALNMLDLGCGTGLSSREFFKRGWNVTGIDLTPEMIEKASCYPFSQLICQSLEDSLPFDSCVFDGAILIGVMEFIQNPARLFNEVARLLKPQGLFGLTIPKKITEEQEKKLGIQTYAISHIEMVFGACGFSVLKNESFQGFISDGEIIEYEGYLLGLGFFGKDEEVLV